MGIPLFRVDAFTGKAFGGNPAAVCLLPASGWPPDAWLQDVAMEMNLSETAFVKPEGDGFGLRWFTPAREVELCGHATLAAAHVLWSEKRLPPQAAAVFGTRSGTLVCTKSTGHGDFISMDFPDESAQGCEAPPGLVEALGIVPVEVLRNRMDYLFVLRDEAAVRSVRPMARAPALQDPVRGFIVTSRAADPEHDYVCRYFAPAYGIDEDPVTGSIQCALGPFWAARLGKPGLKARQLSRRGGVLHVKVEAGRVGITGQAVTTSRGELARAALHWTQTV